MREHILGVQHQLSVFFGHSDRSATASIRAREWSAPLYAALGAAPTVAHDADLQALLMLIGRGRGIPVPYSDYANTTPRERPSDAHVHEMLARLGEHWDTLAGAELAMSTRPVGFTGRKKRRLVVEADAATRAPWGTWHSLGPGPERQTFSALRRTINDFLSPHGVDHIEFIARV